MFQKAADKVLRVPRVGDFDECPAPEAAVVVDGGHPQRARRGNFGGLVFLLFAGDFDDQVQQVVSAVAVIDAGDEVGDVVLFLAIERVGDGEAEVVILHVADDLGHVFQRLRHFLLPGFGVGDDMGDVALVGVGWR